MKTVHRVWAALALLPSVFVAERSAKADVLIPAASDPLVLEDNCRADALAPGEFRCFSKRWMPQSIVAARRANAPFRATAGGCDGQKMTAYSPTRTPASMGADDLAKAYNLPTEAVGAGHIVGIVDACGYTDLVKDLNAYRATFGLPSISLCGGKVGVAPTKGGPQCIGVVSQTGTATLPADDSNWSGETALDVDMVSAACPECSIVVVQAKNAGTLPTAVAEAVKLGAEGVSNSWGSVESPLSSAFPSYPGTLIAAASGDADYLNEIQNIDEDAGTVDYTPQAPNWPASDPNVLGVGGTTLKMDENANRCYSDSAWSFMVPTTSKNPLHGKYVYGGGSGCSQAFQTPSYQSSLDMGSCQMRGSVDVSAAADFDPGDYKKGLCKVGLPCGGIGVYGGGGWNPSVGTSASTPFVVGVLVRMGLAAKANSYFYANHGGFTDVTVGNNDPSGTCTDVMCNAKTGWDGPTGWGTPNGYELGVQGGVSVTQPTPPTCPAVPAADAGVPVADSGTGTGDDSGTGTGDDSGTGTGDDSGTGTGDDDSGSTEPTDSGTHTGSDAGSTTHKDAGLTADGGHAGDGGSGNGDTGGDGSGDNSGCGCSVVGQDGSAPLAPAGLALAALGAVIARVRRRK